jgi:Tfp pilus assembly protein PilN
MIRRMNLVPAGERRRTQTDLGVLGMIVAAIMAVGVMGLVYFTTSGQLSEKQTQLAEIQMQNTQLQAQAASLAAYGSLAEQKKQAEAVAQQVYQQRTLVSEVLGDVSLVVPDNVWFSKMTVTAPAIAAPSATGGAAAPAAAAAAAAQGAVGKLSIAATTYSFEDVSRLLVRLQQVPSLKDVTLTSAQGATTATTSTSTTGSQSGSKAAVVEAGVINAQPLSATLPISLTEVQGQ